MNIAVADLHCLVANPDYNMSIPDNLISGEEIVDKFMSRNMLSFMEKNFR